MENRFKNFQHCQTFTIVFCLISKAEKFGIIKFIRWKKINYERKMSQNTASGYERSFL